MAAQIPDIIFILGERMDLYSNPLEQYWITYKKKRPDFHRSPDCKRGYIATWGIDGKDLILKNIDGNVDRRFLLFWRKKVRYSLNMLFSRAGIKGVKASWFSGKIRIPQGKRTLYVHNEYDSRFEKEMVISIIKGVVVKTVVVDNVQQKLQVEQL